MNTETLRKNLVRAIRTHTEQSQSDRNAKQSINTLICAMFNLLACKPTSKYTSVDERYLTDLKTAARERDMPTLMPMVNAYMAYLAALPPFSDVISDVGSEFIGSGGEGLGQFMTPRDLALLAAQLAMHDGQSGVDAMRVKVRKGERIRVGDPTGCGTGGLMLAALSELHRDAPEVLSSVDMDCVDIDPDMARATAVQIVWSCLLHGVPMGSLTVYRANILSEYTSMTPAFIFAPFASLQCVGGVQ